MTLPVAVVLAAGVGRRLAPLTDDTPKALLEIEGTTLLQRTLDALRAAGFSTAAVVTGHHAQLVDRFLASRDWGMHVTAVFNRHFDTANNIVSLLAAADVMPGGFCLLCADVLFDGSMVEDLAKKTTGCWLVVDEEEPLGEEEMKVKLDADRVVERISKTLPPDECAGEYIGLASFDPAATRTLLDAARALVDAGRTELYYEDAVDAAARALSPKLVSTRGRRWTEIDDLNDYERAVAIAAELAPVSPT